jgi:putative ABC transport system permease protein
VSWQSVLVAVGGGLLAAIVAVLSPLRDILSRDPLAAVAPREHVASARAVARLSFAGAVCLGVAVAILFARPQAAIVGMILLVVAMLLGLPVALSLALVLVRRLAPRIVSAMPHIAAIELGAAPTRAVAIAATGAIAVFGSVAIQGAHADLLAGLEDAAHDLNAFTDVWVSPSGSYNLLNTTPFAPTEQSRLEHVHGVRAVRVYRGGLLDFGQGRVWVIAPPCAASPLLPTSQLVEGDLERAIARVRLGGWVAISQALASERHLRIGEAFTLPSPNPTAFRVAALLTNIGWPPGAIVMNASDFARAWGSDDAAAYNVLLDPGVSTRQVVASLERGR